MSPRSIDGARARGHVRFALRRAADFRQLLEVGDVEDDPPRRADGLHQVLHLGLPFTEPGGAGQDVAGRDAEDVPRPGGIMAEPMGQLVDHGGLAGAGLAHQHHGPRRRAGQQSLHGSAEALHAVGPRQPAGVDLRRQHAAEVGKLLQVDVVQHALAATRPTGSGKRRGDSRAPGCGPLRARRSVAEGCRPGRSPGISGASRCCGHRSRRHRGRLPRPERLVGQARRSAARSRPATRRWSAAPASRDPG